MPNFIPPRPVEEQSAFRPGPAQAPAPQAQQAQMQAAMGAQRQVAPSSFNPQAQAQQAAPKILPSMAQQARPLGQMGARPLQNPNMAQIAMAQKMSSQPQANPMQRPMRSSSSSTTSPNASSNGSAKTSCTF